MERTRQKAIETGLLRTRLHALHFAPALEREAWLARHNQPATPLRLSAEELLRRPDIRMDDLCELSPDLLEASPAAREQAEIGIKYEGYLEKEQLLIEKARAMEDALLPEDAPYDQIGALRLEARQKLLRQKPRSLAAASRIPGVSPADIAVLMVWLKKEGYAHDL